MKIFVRFVPLLVSSCVTSPKCGNPEGARTIHTGQETCVVRIRETLVGSDMKIPESLKNPDLVSYELTWVDPELNEGKIVLGHFVLVPKPLVVRSKP